MQRNYSDLSPFDFEQLVRDLFQKMLGARLEVFPPGRDGGIDVRLFVDDDEQLIVQCKHSPNKTYQNISTALRKEAKAIKGKIGSPYWLATSASLTANNKAKIVEFFGADVLTQERIIGRHDIDNLLNDYPEVEQNHYKLYLTSVAVLQKVLHTELYFRRDAALASIQRRVKMFVQTPALEQALSILDESKVCLISGQPGVGKTTLAEIVLLQLMQDGYEPAVMYAVSDAETLFRANQRQVFLFDDFLGQNSLQNKLDRGEDGGLIRLIERLSGGNGQHLLIMTTRDYILAQAQQTYTRLRADAISYSRYVLDIKAYNKFHRAHILYNHLYYSDLSSKALESVVRDANYERIIRHRGYLPRLIEFIVTFALRTGGSAGGDGFADFAVHTLDHPDEVWREIFEVHLSRLDRHVIAVLASFPNGTTVETLRRAVIAHADHVGAARPDSSDYSNSLDVLAGLVVRVDERVANEVTFSNPSFLDFFLTYMARNPGLLDELASSFVFRAQGQTLMSLFAADNRAVKGSDRGALRKRLSTLADDLVTRQAALLALDKTASEAAPGSSSVSIDRHAAMEHLRLSKDVADFLRIAQGQLRPLAVRAFAEAVGEVWSQRSYWKHLDASDRETAVKIVDTISHSLPNNDASLPVEEVENEIRRYRHPSDLVNHAALLESRGEDAGHLCGELESRLEEYKMRVEDAAHQDDGRSERNALSSAAQIFGLDIEDLLEELDAIIDELPDEYEGDFDSEEESVSRPLGREEEYSDEAIADMFDSLLGR